MDGLLFQLFMIIFQGAFWGLMGGLIIGMLRFFVEFSYSAPPCGSSEYLLALIEQK